MFCHSPRFLLSLASVFVALAASNSTGIRANDAGYQKEVSVREPTRLDWVFAVANQSRTDPPKEWLGEYDSAQQRYELFVPALPSPSKTTAAARPQAKKKSSKELAAKSDATRGDNGLPLVLFISAGDQPAGWNQLETACREKGFAFASPFGAGNNTPMPKRIRIVLDVLDDIRRKHKVDPDRTYVAGFSGGGRVACGITFALPELFGGVIPVCAAGDLRDETWLRHRVIDRLSVALITGTGDFNRGEVELFRGPMLTDVGVRTKVTVVPQMGHGIPDSTTFAEALDWLDAGAVARRKLAQSYPASRLAGDATSGREESAKALFAEGQSRLTDANTLYSGLMQLQGVLQRWPDLDVAEKAKALLLEYEGRNERPWEADDISEQRRFLIARARGLSDYSSGNLPPQYVKQRAEMLAAAIQLWELIVQDGQDETAVEEAKRRLPELKKLANE